MPRDIPNEAFPDAPAIKCPCCGESWRPNSEVFSRMSSEVGKWDYRYEDPKDLMMTLLEVLSDNSAGLVPNRGDISLKGGGVES